jgi:shikimate kinase
MQQKENTVVSCGGGVPMRTCNVEAMRKSGKIVYLDTSAETIYHRVKDCHHRPLLEGNMNMEYISGLLAERMPKYLAAADVTVATDGKKLDKICREIVALCEQE